MDNSRIARKGDSTIELYVLRIERSIIEKSFITILARESFNVKRHSRTFREICFLRKKVKYTKQRAQDNKCQRFTRAIKAKISTVLFCRRTYCLTVYK